MKKIYLLFTLLVVTNVSTYSQLKVDSLGKVQVGGGNYKDALKVFGSILLDPDNTGRNNGVFFRRADSYHTNGTWGIDLDYQGLNFWKCFPLENWGNCKLLLKDKGGIGINNCEPAYALDIIGTVRANSFLVNSDIRLKKGIFPLSNCLSKLALLQPSSYLLHVNPETNGQYEKEEWNVSEMKASNQEKYKKQYGFIAQEVRKILPEIVEEDMNGQLSVDYIALIPMLIESIKEQQVIINNLQGRMAEIENGSINSLQIKGNSVSQEKELADEKVLLFQNSPNPFKVSTEIYYHLPNKIQNAFLYIYDLTGNLLVEIPITERGYGKQLVHTKHLKPATYLYLLNADGTETESKKMIVN